MLSAIIFIFYPEEVNYITACLESVKFADEIVVVDNGATPETLAIVKKYRAKIYRHDSKDFSQRHNFAVQKATGDWLLFVDADERVSKALALEIRTVLTDDSASAWQLNRVNFYLGKKVRFGDRFPDTVTRLFRKEKLLGWSGEIHESSRVEGRIGSLSQPLYHLTHRDISSMVEKTLNYAQHEVNLRLQTNHPPVVGWRLIRVILTEFFIRFGKYQAWRQGTEGWIDGLFQTFSLFIFYALLWERQRREPLAKTYEEIDQKILAGEEI